MLFLDRFSFGVGDRFARQAEAQLAAFQRILADGVRVVPVWNKSNREHTLIGSEPVSVRVSAQRAVQILGWTLPWHVDADHIGLATVDRFLDCCDFFTIDVAEQIGQPADEGAIRQFVDRHRELVGTVTIAGVDRSFDISKNQLEQIAGKYLQAVVEAGRIYRRIVEHKGGPDRSIIEVSMDETDSPQTPYELLVILAGLADQGVPAQTIAPKFTGRFLKGVDYQGDLAQFEREFAADVAVLRHAAAAYGLPANLKLSVHSGSDKFSLYPVIGRILKATGAGLHLKTAGTTWLEEVIGLAEAEGDGLEFAKNLYGEALAKIDELSAPYAAVVEIDRSRLPRAIDVSHWSGERFARMVRHDPHGADFNPHVRQLLHISFKLAAKSGPRFYELLEACRDRVSGNVTENLYRRHMRPLWVD